MSSFLGPFRLDCVRTWLIALALTCSTAIPAIAQIDTDPFNGQPAAGAAGMRTPDLPSGENIQRPGGEKGDLVFRSQTEIVEVPAVVTDKSGHVLHGLTKEDFRVFEDGKERRIASFEEVDTANLPMVRPTPPGQFSNVSRQIHEPQSVVIIVLDTVNTPFLDQAYARWQVLRYLANNSSAHQTLGLVVISEKGAQVLCGLGTDPATLVSALKKATGHFSPMEGFGVEGKTIAASNSESNEIWASGTRMGEDASEKLERWITSADAVEGRNQQARSTELTLKAFLSLAWSLSGVPGRKSLIWLTGSFPFPIDSESALPGKWADLYEKTMLALNNAQVSVYPVDARGVVDTGVFGGTTSSPSAVFQVDARTGMNDSALASMRMFADMTGGRAFYNTNDLAGAIASAADDSASYYLIAYDLDTHNKAPGWRKLRVQVKRRDVVVRARSGFLETRLTTDPELTHKADVEFALSSPFDTTAIPVTARWLGTTQEGDKKKIGFSLDMPESSLVDESNKNLFDLDLLVQLSSGDKPPVVTQKTIKGLIPPPALSQIKSDGMIYNNFLTLPRGQYEVRFLVRDNISGRVGTVSAPLIVH